MQAPIVVGHFSVWTPSTDRVQHLQAAVQTDSVFEVPVTLLGVVLLKEAGAKKTGLGLVTSGGEKINHRPKQNLYIFLNL